MHRRAILSVLFSAAVMIAGPACGGDKKCTSDADCAGKKGQRLVCWDGRCVNLKAAGGRARRGRPTVDPNVTFKVKVDPKVNPIKGPVHAPVTIVEFSDFQCPYCGRGSETMARLNKAYPKEVRVVFMHNPLSFHKQALLAAEASQAVFALKGNDAFWKYHDILFKNKDALQRENLEKWAQELGVDMTKLKAALDKRTYKQMVLDQQRYANKLGVTGAPAFYVNGKFINGAQPYNRFKTKVDAALDEAKKLLGKGVKLPSLYAHIIKKGKTKAVFVQ